jgi:hypothetical protein
MEMYCDIDDHDSKSNFKNPYHNPVLVREQRGWDEAFIDEEFQLEEFVKDHFQCFVDWNSLPTYDTYINDENLIEVSFLSYGQDAKLKVDNYVFNQA